MVVYCSEINARMKIVPQKIEYEVSEIKVLPKVEGKTPSELIIKVDPPIGGKALEALLKSKDLEVEDGKLVSFK